MKKVFFISLLLVSAFIIGSSGVAWAPPPLCTNYQDYECNYTYYVEGKTNYIDTDCLKICYDKNFEVDVYGDCFTCYLYPATGSKNLLGIGDTCGGMAGCSVEFKGRSIITKVTFVEYSPPGLENISRCTPCNDCCH
jgi:hypothetical protein